MKILGRPVETVLSLSPVIRIPGICLALVVPLPAAVDPRLEYAFGVLAECRGETGAATTRFENARLADPLAAPLVERGVARLLAEGDRSGATGLYRDFAAARPDDLSAQLGYADFLTQQGKGDALALKLAVETLDAPLTKNPGHPEIIRRLFSLLRSRNESDRAASLLEGLSSDDPASVMLFAVLSRGLHEADDAVALAEIDRRYLLALGAHPENQVLAREVSDHFRDTRRLDQAIDALKRNTEATPWSLDARVRLGILQFSAKLDDDGEKSLKQVLEIHPRQALAHQALAKFYRLRGKPEAAAFHAAELLKIRGGSPSEFIKLADERMAAGDARSARLLLERAVFDHPEHQDLLMKLAVATQQDATTRARAPRLFREAEAAFGERKISDPAFLTASAEALIGAGQSKAGEERLRAAIRAFPTDAKKDTAATLRRLATLWETENRNLDAARALRQRAGALDPK